MATCPVFGQNNPFFGEYTNQVTVNIGQGVNSGFLVAAPEQFVPFNMFHFQYSRPDTFFTLPARTSLNFAQMVGFDERYGWNWPDYSMPVVFLSQDAAFYSTGRFYFGAGMGAGFQGRENERIGSKLLFGFKVFAGYKIAAQTNMEIFMQHFSNGNTGYANNSYAFYGLGVSYNF